MTGDRTEFIGRNGRLQNPAAMSARELSGRVGAGLDPCGAIRVPFELLDGQTTRNHLSSGSRASPGRCAQARAALPWE